MKEIVVEQQLQFQFSNYEKTVRQCPTCNVPFEELRNKRFIEPYVPMVIVGFCKTHNQFFKQPEDVDLQKIQEAREFVNRCIHLPIAGLDVPSGPKSDDLLSRGVKSFADLFTYRQLIYIVTCKELLDSVDDRHRLWLGLLISTSLEFNSLLCGYKGSDKRRPGAIRHVFSHHAYSFPYTVLENNPVFSGNTSARSDFSSKIAYRPHRVGLRHPLSASLVLAIGERSHF